MRILHRRLQPFFQPLYPSLMKTRVFLFVSVAGLPLTVFGQGSLNPLGPPGQTMKSLDQVEARTVIDPRQPSFTFPYTISTPGSYYLATNLTPPANTNAIVVNSDNVTIDLNGFSITGVNSVGYTAIQVGIRTGFCARNGMVNKWTASGPGVTTTGGGISAQYASGALFEKLILINNSGGPGLTTGDGCTIKDCVARNQQGTGSNGIQTGYSCTVVDCTATGNGGSGIYFANGGSAINCSATGNGGDGIQSGDGCSIIHCTAGTSFVGGSNTGFGINAGEGCTVTGSTAAANGKSGISLGIGSAATDCTAFGNSVNGIVASSSGCRITNCSSGQNLVGILLNAGSTVRDCTVRSNQTDGISGGSNSLIVGNNCDANDTSNNGSKGGINTAGNGNTIDGNSCTANGSGGGIISTGSNNVIIRNSCSGNGFNYNIPGTNNTYGPVINMSSGGAISSASGTVNPWTNWIH